MDSTGQIKPAGRPFRVTATLWEDEGTYCYQVEVRGFCVARRHDNRMINGTKLLNVAGVPGPRRDGILKSEPVRRIVKMGPSHVKGVWITFERALDLANYEKITELMFPLFLVDIGSLVYPPISRPGRSNDVGRAGGSADEEYGQEVDAAYKTPRAPRTARLDRAGRDTKTEAEGLSETLLAPSSDQAELPLISLHRAVSKGPWTRGVVSYSASALSAPEDERASRPVSPEHGRQPPSVRLSPSMMSPPCSSSDSCSSDEEHCLLSREAQKAALLDRLMTYFVSIFASSRSPSPAPGTLMAGTGAWTGSGSGSGGNGSIHGQSVPSTTSTASSWTTVTGKSGLVRKRPTDEEDEDEDEAKGGGQGVKRSRIKGGVNPAGRRLACPYFKKDPDRFQLGRSCSGPGWETVHRLKEHLDRNHAMPISCLRCYRPFKTEADRDAHMRSAERCEVREQPPRTDGFDARQKDQLKTRPKGYKQMSEHQKWRRIYLILFPETEEADIPSPYYEFKSVSDPSHPLDPMLEYEHFLRRQLPERVRHELERRIEDALDPMEETLRGQIVDIVRDTQLQLFQSFMSSIAPAPPAPALAVQGLTEGLPPENITTKETTQTSSAVVTGDSEPIVAVDTRREMGGRYASTTHWNWEDQLQAYRPEPVLDADFTGFDGLLFDFGQMANMPAPDDSAYGSMLTDHCTRAKEYAPCPGYLGDRATDQHFAYRGRGW